MMDFAKVASEAARVEQDLASRRAAIRRQDEATATALTTTILDIIRPLRESGRPVYSFPHEYAPLPKAERGCTKCNYDETHSVHIQKETA